MRVHVKVLVLASAVLSGLRYYGIIRLSQLILHQDYRA